MLYSSTRKENSRQQASDTEVSSLSALLDKIESLADKRDEVSVRDIQEIVGKRWYGPMLLITGLVMMTPVIGDIPGVPVMMGLIVILMSLQLIVQRNRVWLPGWIMKQHVSSRKVRKTIQYTRKPSHFVDSFTTARQTWVVRHAGLFVIAIMSMMVAAITPVLELIPFSATLAGFAISAFGISVLARDGVVGMVAIVFCLCTLGTALSYFY